MEDKRKDVRIPKIKWAKIKDEKVVIADISLTGAKIVSPHKPKGLEIDLLFEKGTGQYILPATIKWVVKEDVHPDKYQMGIEFAVLPEKFEKLLIDFINKV